MAPSTYATALLCLQRLHNVRLHEVMLNGLAILNVSTPINKTHTADSELEPNCIPYAFLLKTATQLDRWDFKSEIPVKDRGVALRGKITERIPFYSNLISGKPHNDFRRPASIGVFTYRFSFAGWVERVPRWDQLSLTTLTQNGITLSVP